VIDHPLHAVALYNPAFQSREELIKFFIARQTELAQLLDALRREGHNPPQHHLIVGARGMGKTTLIHRLRFAIADDPDLGKSWLGLTFPEEQYNVGALSDFWLNCVDALADTLESAGQALPDLDAQVARINKLTREEDRRGQALDLLRRSADHIGRRLVLLVDNIDLILDRFKDDDWALREVLSNEPRLLLIGATAAPLEAQYQYGKAFYDFFRVHALRGIEREETFTVLRTLAKATNQPHVAKVVDEQPGRIETLRLFAGGNPRTLTLLFNLLAQGTEGDVRADLERLLDLYTPLYKARFESFAPQTQRVIDALALHHHPATAHQIAEATRLDVKAVSTHLDRLRRDGLVEPVELPDERKMGFQIAERFFNIWYLMRTSRRVRTRLLWLVEFLRLMYAPEELAEQARQVLKQPVRDPQRRAETSLVYASLVKDPSLQRALETHGLHTLMHEPGLRRRLSELLDFEGEDASLKVLAERMRLVAETEEAISSQDSTNAPIMRALLAGHPKLSVELKHQIARGMNEEAELPIVAGLFVDLLKFYGLFVPDELGVLNRALAGGCIDEHMDLDELKAAAALYDAPSIVACGLVWRLQTGQSVELPLLREAKTHSRSLVVRHLWVGMAHEAGHPREALLADIEEIDLSLIWQPDLLRSLGDFVQDKLMGYAQAEAIYRSIVGREGNLPLRVEDSKVQLDEQGLVHFGFAFARPWYGLGFLYHHRMKRPEDAEVAYREALKRDESQGVIWLGLADLLKEQPGRQEDAEAAYRRASEADSPDPRAFLELGLLLEARNQVVDAEACYRQATERDPSLSMGWFHLGALLQTLSRPAEAVAALREAISRESEFGELRAVVAELLWIELGQPDEAEAMLRQMPLDGELGSMRAFGLAHLYRHTGRFAEARSAFREGLALSPDHAGEWEALGDLLHYELEEGVEAEAAYRRAIELDSGRSGAWEGLGDVLIGDPNRRSEAESAYRKAAEDPENARALERLGDLLKYLAREAEAEEAYRGAIARDANSPWAWYGLASLLGERPNGRTEAEAAYRRALDLEPDASHFNNGFAWNLYQWGRSQEAAAHAMAAWEADREEAGYAHTLATIEAALGRWAEEPVRTFLQAGDEYLQSIWPDVLRFFAEVVSHGLVDDARRVLRELGLIERYEPLDRALEIAAAGDATKLGRLAPEVRQAVVLVLERIAPDLSREPPKRR
jgi:tetratricopeptide (TPR) repeat protein/DNA-binding transcriptional ArsR family regulator